MGIKTFKLSGLPEIFAVLAALSNEKPIPLGREGLQEICAP